MSVCIYYDGRARLGRFNTVRDSLFFSVYTRTHWLKLRHQEQGLSSIRTNQEILGRSFFYREANSKAVDDLNFRLLIEANDEI
jgi:hypothetical protein